ncbi:MAG: MerR family transcriptional regulator [Candidatus Cloacimonetes bacterium]|nr:MerR family transcriptional regulator [Candidatus Cloacimonadota bacterium]
MPKHYYQIGEVANMLSVKKHTLRFWETEFPLLKPRKNRSGNRIYTLEDIELLKQIKFLLYEQNYSIEGARKKLAKTKKEPVKIEIPVFAQAKSEIRKKLKDKVEKLQDIIEVTPTVSDKMAKKEKVKEKINKIYALINSRL